MNRNSSNIELKDSIFRYSNIEGSRREVTLLHSSVRFLYTNFYVENCKRVVACEVESIIQPIDYSSIHVLFQHNSLMAV